MTLPICIYNTKSTFYAFCCETLTLILELPNMYPETGCGLTSTGKKTRLVICVAGWFWNSIGWISSAAVRPWHAPYHLSIKDLLCSSKKQEDSTSQLHDGRMYTFHLSIKHHPLKFGDDTKLKKIIVEKRHFWLYLSVCSVGDFYLVFMRFCLSWKYLLLHKNQKILVYKSQGLSN